MRAITIRDEFSALKDFTASLPQTFDRQGLLIHNSRNVIKKIDTREGTLVVKNFAGMYFFNRLAYSFFRKSKAARSYLYSAMLNERGIMTPPHVAWMDCYSMGLLTKSYYVSVFFPYRTLEEMIQYQNVFDPTLKGPLIRDLAVFIRKLHTKGVYHEDLSLGNILVIRTVRGYDFALVDLNRIKFREINKRDSLRNFATLRLAPDDINALIGEYATLAGLEPASSKEYFWRYRDRKFRFRRLRRKLRDLTITPVEHFLLKKH